MEFKDQSVVSSLLQLRRVAVPLLALGLMLAACAAELDDPDLYKNALGSGGGATSTGGTASGTGGSPPAATGGTPSSGTGGSGPAVSDCWKRAIETNCVACHTNTPGLQYSGLNLAGGDAMVARLSGIPATNAEVPDKSGCSPGALLIDPANPMNSVMYKRIKNLQGSCGTSMPLGIPLNATDMKCVEDWILSF